MTPEQLARQAGVAANNLGKHLNANPYSPVIAQELYSAWREGWNSADEDARPATS